MTPVPRLDYSKPPPGYSTWTYKGATLYQAPNGEQIGPRSAAWAHYKAHNNPPGMRSDSYGYGQDTVAQTWWVMHNLEADADAARAAAWAWYDRRLVLADTIDAEAADVAASGDEVVDMDAVWPRCLTWSDDQVSEVERRLVDSTAEMPEELRG